MSVAFCGTCGIPVVHVRFRSRREIYCDACADVVEKTVNKAAGMPHLPYEVIKNTLKGTGFSAAGDPCIDPGRNCSGHIVRDPIELRHRCDVCGYGF